MNSNHIVQRAMYVLMFVTLFSVLGYFLPRIYLQYIDKTEYFTVEQPVSVTEKEYHACDKVEATIVRTYKGQATTADVIVEILLERTDGLQKKTISQAQFALAPGEKTPAIIHYKLPCDTDPGAYYLRGTVTYSISQVEKSYVWVSGVFVVKEKEAEENVR